MDIKANWYEVIVEGYNKGYSDVEICRDLAITPRQFNRAIKDNPKFAELIEYGRMLAGAWWSSQARSSLGDRSFNTPLYIMYMKNNHDWKDKVESVNIDAIEGTSLAEIKRKLREDLPKLLERMKAEPKQLEVLDGDFIIEDN